MTTKKKNVKRYKLVCLKCEYTWEGRLKNPKSCPLCKSYDWGKK